MEVVLEVDRCDDARMGGPLHYTMYEKPREGETLIRKFCNEVEGHNPTTTPKWYYDRCKVCNKYLAWYVRRGETTLWIGKVMNIGIVEDIKGHYTEHHPFEYDILMRLEE